MIQEMIVRNFKQLRDARIPLGNPVVFVGPNNMGKTSALQALTLWEVGLRVWTRRYGVDSRRMPKERPGVSINRKDLSSIPIPSSLYLWNELRVRNTEKDSETRKTRTSNVLISIEVRGITNGKEWCCPFDFDYANSESFYCRFHGDDWDGLTAASNTHLAFLPSMSGLAAQEYIKQPGEINFLIGQGQTAQVMRNLCWKMSEDEVVWPKVTEIMKRLFGVVLNKPEIYEERSEILMSYVDESGKTLDLSCAGRGFHQTLLLMAYLYTHPGHTLLLDEPDAHLEILRQRQIFDLLCELADEQGAQVIMASHSEVVLNAGVEKGTVVAFVGKPHILEGGNKGAQVVKSLREIGFDQYYLAEQRGWVIYMEDVTDLDIMRAFAKKLCHPAEADLDSPFFHPLGCNVPQNARNHFFGLREAKPDLRGVILVDRIEKELNLNQNFLVELMWERTEIENYFSNEEVLLAYARAGASDDLFGFVETERRVDAMSKSINEVMSAYRTLRGGDPLGHNIKASNDFLDPVFKRFSDLLGMPLLLRKREYCKLVSLMEPESIPAEVVQKLDAIHNVASSVDTFAS